MLKYTKINLFAQRRIIENSLFQQTSTPLGRLSPSFRHQMIRTNFIDRVNHKIPKWHFEMLHDSARNAAIEAAIASSGVGGKIVVEIGTGAGLPALLFAKYGAKRVFTCEVNGEIADVTRKIIQKNNFHDRIIIISKSSRQAIIDCDLPSTPDIIFTETLDCGVIGEGYETIAEDGQIAGPGTVVMPDRIQQFGFLCTDEKAFEKISYLISVDLIFPSLTSSPKGRISLPIKWRMIR
ncbi:hypothetical protein AB4Y42_42260 [Paraburkholderia sp. EG286B]|uniref:hypothetical protein n=1 Tax=Paraburkholderia sp. EG286B TaxID=3237011 RepID=UPI0034D20733